MGKKEFLIAAFCVAITLMSCNVSARHEKLIGGIRAAVESELMDEENASVNQNDAFGKVEAAEGLEIPGSLDGVPEQILKRKGYTASYNKSTLIPNWVAWHLTAEHCEGTEKRPRKAFHEDNDVPEPRATDWDYYNSGYDRGHLCPAADNKWDAEAMLESFLFTNICPQNHSLNAGDWEELENACRLWAKKFGDVYIVSGPLLYKGKHKTIGKNKVTVPEAFFKVVLCMQGTPKAIGFICENKGGNRSMDYYVKTVDEVEEATGIDFFPSLPDGVEDVVEASCNLEDWSD